MKKFQKITIIFLSASVILGAIFNFIYQRNTPKTVGEVAFPLKKEWNLCVGGEIIELSSDGEGLILAKTRTALSAYDQAEGSLVWTVSIEEQSESFPPVIVGNKVFISDKKQLWSFDLKTGKELWKSPLTSTDAWIPSASNKYVLLNSRSDSIVIYNAISGNKLWEFPGGRGYTQAFIENDIVYLIDRGVKALDAVNGNILWELDNGRVTGLSNFRNGVIYFMEYPGNNTFDLIAYSTELRTELWKINFPDNHPRGLYLYDKFLYLTENEALYQIDSENGETKWQKVLSAPTNLSFTGNNVYVLERFYRVVHTIDIRSGNELGSLQIAPQRILGTETQEMVSSGTSLVFSRGCEIFVYGN